MSTGTITAQIAMGPDFLEAFSKLPRQTQGKLRRFMEEFRENPTSNGYNFEKIKSAPDGNLRSVRIDQGYRGILLQSDRDDAFVFLWADKHDAAYDWAAGRRVSIHPSTGVIQIIPVVESGPVADSAPEQDPGFIAPPAQAAGPKLFDPYSDDELIRLGLPEELLPIVRSVYTQEQLQRIGRRLPADVLEALSYLAAGIGYQEVLTELGLDEVPETVDTSDIAAALQNPLTQRSLTLVTSDEHLKEVLDYPLDKWRIFLHPVQRKLVEMNSSGALRVLGGAGTGKTVVAMHRAKHLAEKVFTQPQDRILFTTFNINLATDIAKNLDKLCPPAVRERIEVLHINGWAHDYLKRMRYKVKIVSSQQQQELWETALTHKDADANLSDGFYRTEWESVIQYHGIVNIADYLTVKRTGAGTRLSRLQRKKAWQVFSRYRELLAEKQLLEFTDELRLAKDVLQQNRAYTKYRAVLIDEAQDMLPEAFKLARSIVAAPDEDIPPNSLFIVGDAHQRIYNYPVRLSALGIPIVGRSRRLKLNYRTTQETCAYASAILAGIDVDDLDGQADSLVGYTSLVHGETPHQHAADDIEQEAGYIAAQIQQWVGDDDSTDKYNSICITLRTNKLVSNYAELLEHAGLPVTIIGKEGEKDEDGVRLATMHRVKGLEFDYLILASANNSTLPYPSSFRSAETETEKDDVMKKERSLVYVALTRARKAAMITWSGEKSELL